MANYAVTDPATGQVHASYPTATDEQITEALEKAQRSYERWAKKTSVAERAELMQKLAHLMLERKEELGAIFNREMGKPLAQCVGEVEFSAGIIESFAKNAVEWLADDVLSVEDGLKTVVKRQGLGVILGIMPWNYPFYQVARFAAPALLVGNTVVLKHAEQCPESALALEELFAQAGFPSGAYVNVFASHDQIKTMIEDSRVKAVSLTGSERAGAIVGEIAGRNLKKCVLELGGSDPFIVLDVADLDAAVEYAVAGRMENSGQACNASKRIIVLEKYYEEFTAKFVEQLKALQYDPANGDYGPLSSCKATEGLRKQVERALEQGASLLYGSGSAEGNHFAPCVLTGVTEEMDAFHEEFFGPVAQVYKVANDEEAVELANSSPYGLGSVVMCDDIERAERVGDQLDVGMVFINASGLEGVDVPFGGVKNSGFGREIGKYGIDEFANKKLYRYAA